MRPLFSGVPYLEVVMYCYGQNQVSFIQRCPLFGRTFSEVEQVPSLPPLLFLHSMSLPFSLLSLPPSLPLCHLCVVQRLDWQLGQEERGRWTEEAGRRGLALTQRISVWSWPTSLAALSTSWSSPRPLHTPGNREQSGSSLSRKWDRKIPLTYTLKGTWQYVWAKFNNRDTVKRITFHF